MLQVSILTNCAHTYEVEIEAVVEAPLRGSPVTCEVCGEATTIIRVGIPHRVISSTDNPVDPGQESMFKE